MSLGAIIAGPFDIAERDLSAMIENVMAAQRSNAEAQLSATQATQTSETIH
jgi:hypothetical protein